jgi:hypothetical protein
MTDAVSAPLDADWLWRAVARGESPDAGPEARHATLRRFADLVSPALAADLLPLSGSGSGSGPDWTDLISGDALRQSRLLARFAHRAQRAALGEIARAGFACVALKGFANAHLIYRVPETRIVGDLDILVRPGDLAGLVAHLGAAGYRFRGAPPRLWGFISEASFLPFVSADGGCNLDLHVEPDCYPLYRGLGVEALFRAARPLDLDGLRILVPAPEHALALCLSNAVKDKLGVFALRKAIDAMLLLRGTRDLDWAALEGILRDGRLTGPGRAFFALLEALGLEPGIVPRHLARPPGGLAAGEFRRVLAEWRGLFSDEPGLARLLRRELLLCAEPRVALYNHWLRLAGLVAPGSGLPEAARDLAGLHASPGRHRDGAGSRAS